MKDYFHFSGGSSTLPDWMATDQSSDTIRIILGIEFARPTSSNAEFALSINIPAGSRIERCEGLLFQVDCRQDDRTPDKELPGFTNSRYYRKRQHTYQC
jgi:hypothetical protein